MGKTQYTPGPWGLLAGCYTPENGYFWMVQVADRATAYAFEETNANLIAAAPELYEVLAKFMDFKDSDYVPNNLFERARSVLKKARGETHPSGGDRHGE